MEKLQGPEKCLHSIYLILSGSSPQYQDVGPNEFCDSGWIVIRRSWNNETKLYNRMSGFHILYHVYTCGLRGRMRSGLSSRWICRTCTGVDDRFFAPIGVTLSA